MKKISVLTLVSVMMFGGMARADVASALSNVNEKVEAVQNACSGIKSNLDSIFGLSVATTVSSGLGTAAAGGALATGIVKNQIEKKENKIDEKLKTDEEIKEELLRDYIDEYKWDHVTKDKMMNAVMSGDDDKIKETIAWCCHEWEAKDEMHGSTYDVCYDHMVSNFISEYSGWKLRYKTKLKELSNNKRNEESQTLGNVRTGLMAGATATSAVSTGTSIGTTLTATKLAEKMSQCNNALRELKIAKGQLEVEGEVSEKANEIVAACTGYDESNIKSLKTLATANVVVSGIGTATAGAGTVTSVMANSKKVRDGNKKKEKNLNLASNILAGVTMGTSGTSTALSAVQISKAKKDSEMAERCEAALK